MSFEVVREPLTGAMWDGYVRLIVPKLKQVWLDLTGHRLYSKEDVTKAYWDGVYDAKHRYSAPKIDRTKFVKTPIRNEVFVKTRIYDGR